MKSPNTYRRLIPILGLLLFFTASSLQGQWLEPKRVKFGASAGFGGVHGWGKPAFDVHWYNTTFRVAPGLYYMSVGLTQNIGFFSPKTRTDRILMLSLYYHNDWLLTNRRRNEFKKNEHAFMLMPGIHVNLNHLGSIFLEVSGGVMYSHEKVINRETEASNLQDRWWPMGEIRIGGIFLDRKERVQQFPHYYKKKPADKIQKRKLKFKK